MIKLSYLAGILFFRRAITAGLIDVSIQMVFPRELSAAIWAFNVLVQRMRLHMIDQLFLHFELFSALGTPVNVSVVVLDAVVAIKTVLLDKQFVAFVALIIAYLKCFMHKIRTFCKKQLTVWAESLGSPQQAHS